MRLLKTIKKWGIIIPNIPLIVFVAIYVIYNVVKEIEIFEVQSLEADDFFTPEIEEFIEETCPTWLRYTTAGIFYLLIAIKIFGTDYF